MASTVWQRAATQKEKVGKLRKSVRKILEEGITRRPDIECLELRCDISHQKHIWLNAALDAVSVFANAFLHPTIASQKDVYISMYISL